jgi:hypothetical protein
MRMIARLRPPSSTILRGSGAGGETARVMGRRDYVCFGSEADICAAKGHVCFTPNNDRESGFPQKVTSALHPKADACSANVNPTPKYAGLLWTTSREFCLQ